MAEGEDPLRATGTWEAPDGSQWHLVFWLKRMDGRPECVGLEVLSHPDAYHRERPLRAATLRDLKFSSELERAMRTQRDLVDGLADLGRRMGAGASFLADEQKFMAERGQGRRITSKDPERVAAVYRERWEAQSKSPTRDTAERLGLSYDQAAKLVQACRESGLLPKTKRGVARGTEETEGGSA